MSWKRMFWMESPEILAGTEGLLVFSANYDRLLHTGIRALEL